MNLSPIIIPCTVTTVINDQLIDSAIMIDKIKYLNFKQLPGNSQLILNNNIRSRNSLKIFNQNIKNNFNALEKIQYQDENMFSEIRK
tara:strand:+ start:513 stop:773 length:261 start_codon:yes stop_codon:yes gene_type:complete